MYLSMYTCSWIVNNSKSPVINKCFLASLSAFHPFMYRVFTVKQNTNNTQETEHSVSGSVNPIKAASHSWKPVFTEPHPQVLPLTKRNNHNNHINKNKYNVYNKYNMNNLCFHISPVHRLVVTQPTSGFTGNQCKTHCYMRPKWTSRQV